MNLSPSKRNVRRIAREYRMRESDVREMLAIESGRSQGDVVSVDELPHDSKPGIRGIISSFLPMLVRFVAACGTCRHSRSRQAADHRAAAGGPGPTEQV